jgi:hypothetical protein
VSRRRYGQRRESEEEGGEEMGPGWLKWGRGRNKGGPGVAVKLKWGGGRTKGETRRRQHLNKKLVAGDKIYTSHVKSGPNNFWISETSPWTDLGNFRSLNLTFEKIPSTFPDGKAWVLVPYQCPKILTENLNFQ